MKFTDLFFYDSFHKYNEAKGGLMERFVSSLIVLPYLLLIHLGMIVWLIFGIFSIAKKHFGINIGIAKIFGSLYGGIVGGLIPYFDLIYSSPGEAWGAAFANVPALFVGSFLVKREGIISSTQWPHYLKYYIPFVIFGLVGGWGIGQLIDWFKKGVIASRKRRQLTYSDSK